jgi:leucyl aminopeptidase
MKLILNKISDANVSTLVVLAAKDKKAGKATFAKLPPVVQKLIDASTSDEAFSGDKKETLFFRQANADGYTNVLVVGLGAVEKISTESFRVAAATILGSLKGNKITSAGVHGDSLAKFGGRVADAALAALAEGVLLSNYEYNDLKSKGKKDDKKTKEKPKLEQISVLLSKAATAAQQKVVQQATILAEAQNFARWLGDSPGNYMTPTILADETVKAAKGTKLKVTVWNKARIEKERMGGLLAVNQGSHEEPRFIIMEYNGAGKGKKPVCLVGKGLTFDTGGISIKPSAGMEEMKYDMCGGAAVIGAMLALAKSGAKVNAIGLVPSTDNMPGPTSFKPGDVYIARNGKSVEVFNTDAEGRLILGEALVYGSEQKPAAIFDAATLTGAILVSLGNTHTGVFTRDEKLSKRIQAAADESGELVWFLPLVDWHVEDMKGTHADLCNISAGRLAGSSTAAAFLEQFVENDVPFAHFDIAGTAWNVNSRQPYHPRKGASGIMVRTFVDLVKSYF